MITSQKEVDLVTIELTRAELHSLLEGETIYKPESEMFVMAYCSNPVEDDEDDEDDDDAYEQSCPCVCHKHSR